MGNSPGGSNQMIRSPAPPFSRRSRSSASRNRRGSETASCAGYRLKAGSRTAFQTFALHQIVAAPLILRRNPPDQYQWQHRHRPSTRAICRQGVKGMGRRKIHFDVVASCATTIVVGAIAASARADSFNELSAFTLTESAATVPAEPAGQLGELSLE